MASIHLVSPFTAFNINALDRDEVRRKGLPLRRCPVALRRRGKVDPEDLGMFPFRASRRRSFRSISASSRAVSFARCISSQQSSSAHPKLQTRAVRETCASFLTPESARRQDDPLSSKQVRLRSMLTQADTPAARSRDVHEAARDRARSLAGTELFAHSRRQRKKVEMLFAHRPPSFPPMAREIKEAPRETGLAGLRAGSRASMPDGHCRWPSFRVGGGETLHHELPISTVRVSDKKSVRVRRCRLGGIWRDFVGSTTQKSIWPTSGRSLPRRHVSSPSMNSPTLKMNGPTLKKSVGIARCAGRHINKKPVRAAKHQGGSGGRQR